MARPAATPEQRRAMRRRIRSAAAELYAEGGPACINVRAIAQRAGISTGTVYSHFENLSELMQSLWAGPVARVGQQLETLAASHDDPVERIAAVLGAYADFALGNPELLRGALLGVRPTSTPYPDPEAPEALPFFRLLAEALREGQQAGRVRDGDPRLLAQGLWASVHGAVALPLNMQRFTLSEPEAIAQAAIAIALRGIAAAPGADDCG